MYIADFETHVKKLMERDDYEALHDLTGAVLEMSKSNKEAPKLLVRSLIRMDPDCTQYTIYQGSCTPVLVVLEIK